MLTLGKRAVLRNFMKCVGSRIGLGLIYELWAYILGLKMGLIIDLCAKSVFVTNFSSTKS